MNPFATPSDAAGADPWQPVRPIGHGSSAPVAIVLALALAATTGVSVRSWGHDTARSLTASSSPATCKENP